MLDLIIIGGGPAGVAAGVYAARKKIKTLLIAGDFGGQSKVSNEIQNWIGNISISGFDLGQALEKHLHAQEEIEIKNDLAAEVKKTSQGFEVKTKNGEIFEGLYLLMASGSSRKKLGIPGEEKFSSKGVSYCATCDAPLFKNKKVAVIGGGNAGLEAALNLLSYSSEIYILEYMESLRGDAITQEKVKSNSKIKILTSVQVLEISGDQFVKSLKYKDRKTGEVKDLEIEGVFVEIGAVPNSDLVKNLVQLDKFGQIIIDPKTQKTSLGGIWAAGDVTDAPYKQNNIAAGDAIKAVLNIYDRII